MAMVGVWARVAWCGALALALASPGESSESGSSEGPTPYTRLLQRSLLLGDLARRKPRGSGTGLGTGITITSGSSSSPVEPIRPLLDLSSHTTGEPQVSPPVPIFDDAAPRNVSELTGNAAYLHCLVHNLGNRSVSWMRQRDLRIMTVGRYTYTTDQRFEVIHSPGSKDWILKIKYAQVRDSGNYECQVSTKPVMSYVVRLSVFAAPQADIIGSPDMHVDMGSTINLTCVISHTPEPPDYIKWTHNGQPLQYDSPRGGITVVTERGNTTSGYLLIQDARASDTGNYTCAPSNTAASTLRVHVLHGETPAAMQHNGSPSPAGRLHALLPLLLLLLPLLTRDSLARGTLRGGDT
ncbi:zwei Ig domain protein zig-8-like [Eriocheir sinensis]|uniref:zwei Ig domain protein zig-8-like n=1 Tax=Eriocheir sinensis TaxID=95602 RepID=UPI0021C630E0|nr:zwei Ig domain protein zig-8-like [Eriocheir sinensis]